MEAAAAIEQGTDWQAAVEAALKTVSGVVERARGVDLTFLFISGDFESAMPEIVKRVREATGTGVLIGCSGGGIIGQGSEVEGRPAISLMVLSLPDRSFFQCG